MTAVYIAVLLNAVAIILVNVTLAVVVRSTRRASRSNGALAARLEQTFNGQARDAAGRARGVR